MSRRKRGLSAEERALWDRVAGTAIPLRPNRPVAPTPDKPKPVAVKPRTPDFRIGEKAARQMPAHDLAVSVEDHLAAMPLRMDRRKHLQLTRGKLDPEARIDLHGMTLAEAHPELIRFVMNAQASGKRLVLVITGKGKQREDHGPIPQRVGVLRHQLPHWLSQAPLRLVVQQVTPAHLKHGGTGAFYLYLRRMGQG